jgi:hypothetical protein
MPLMMKAFLVSFTLLLMCCALFLQAQNPLVGTWEMKTDSTRSIKIITPTHWILFFENLKGDSSRFAGAGGGLYTLAGNKYIEHIDIASWDNYGKERTDYTYKVTGDKFYMKGPLTLADGTVIPIDEVWQKVKSAQAYPKNPAIGTWNQLSSSYTTAEGKKVSHTYVIATCFEVITPTHWMRISHRDNKFEHAMGGPYTLTGNTMHPELAFASFPIDKTMKIAATQRVSDDKRYVHGTITTGKDKAYLTLDDVFQKARAKAQTLKSAAKMTKAAAKK